MSDHPLIDVLPVPADVTAVADGVAALPPALLLRWNRHGGAQVATLYTARRGGELVGAAFEVHRPLTAYRKIVDVWTASSDPSVRAALTERLVSAVVQRAWAEGAVSVKREFRATGPDTASDADWEQSLAAGWREQADTPRWSGPVAGPFQEAPARGQILLREQSSYPAGAGHGESPRPAMVPYMRQTTDFTCGPAALQMGLAALGLRGRPTREAELRLWRRATTVGGCEPLGLALAAAEEGARARVLLSTGQPVLLELCTNDEERDLRAFLQDGFRREAAERGMDVRTEAFSLDTLRAALAEGAVALVLIEQLGMHDESCPHWITVHGTVGTDVFLAHDPWTDANLGESWLDGADLPLPAATLDRLAWYGTPSYRGLVLLEGGGQSDGMESSVISSTGPSPAA
ncbi:peptidase C39 family protein [Kitasatospora sp. NPDC057223]|uniref:peptidase C39 family protein n=1 Tax=Kitasatospora sp. NPDC057223 TaxID=3346055 RepID=UPI003633BC68